MTGAARRISTILRSSFPKGTRCCVLLVNLFASRIFVKVSLPQRNYQHPERHKQLPRNELLQAKVQMPVRIWHVTESKSKQSDDEEDCVYCSETITVTTDSIRCDACKHVYHQACTGLSEEVFTVLTTIINQAGWVCCHCWNQIDSLKCSLAKVNEELADMRVALSGVIAEVKCLKMLHLSNLLPAVIQWSNPHRIA